MKRLILGTISLIILIVVSCQRQMSSSVITPTSTNTATNPSTSAFCTPNKTLKHFAIYYGYPNSLNSSVNSWSNGLVINDLARYDSIVFGGGLESTSHSDHGNTISIISGLHTTNIFGYIDIGKTFNKSILTLTNSIDSWASMGVTGIFIDEFGMDFRDIPGGVTESAYRTRQKTVLDYVHSKGLFAIMNAWDPDDIFIKENTNPLTISAGDRYLYESYFLSSVTRETFTNYRIKVEKLKTAKVSHPGLQIMATTSTATNNFTQALWDTITLGAIADSIEEISWGEVNYSANAILPLRALSSLATNFCIDQTVTINTGGESLNYKANNSTIDIQYNSGSLPTSQTVP